MEEIVYITIEQAIETHCRTIDKSGGGEYGQLDVGKLESVLYHIQNDAYYPLFVDKLTHLFFCTCEFHCFVDGNKRLALSISTLFLILNGYMYIAKDFITRFENISYHVAAGNIDKELLRRILDTAMNGTYDYDEPLKLELYNAISKYE